MIAVYLNCLYIGGRIRKPYFKGHFKNVVKNIKGQKKTPIIAQQLIFDEIPENQRIGIISYPIPQALEDEYLSRFNTEREAWLALINDEQIEYTNFITSMLDKIEEDGKEKIDAILTYIYSPSLHKACKEKDIPIFELEYSPIRYTNYACTMGYFMRENKFSKEESDNRYKKFIQEANGKEFIPLTRKELMALVFLPKNISLIYDYNKSIEYDLAVALGPQDDCLRECFGTMDNDTLIKQAKALYGDSILIRTHPEETQSIEKYHLDIDVSDNSLQFIHKCRRVATITSNVGFEGMLMGKPTYMVGDMPFSGQTMRHLIIDDDMVCDALYLNFLMFCAFTPYELLFDVDYIKWRISNVSELEIYMRNLQYILKELHIEKEILDPPGGRLNRILKARGFEPYLYRKQTESMTKGEKKLESFNMQNIEERLSKRDEIWQLRIRSMKEQEWVEQQLARRDEEINTLERKLARYLALEQRKDQH